MDIQAYGYFLKAINHYQCFDLYIVVDNNILYHCGSTSWPLIHLLHYKYMQMKSCAYCILIQPSHVMLVYRDYFVRVAIKIGSLYHPFL